MAAAWSHGDDVGEGRALRLSLAADTLTRNEPVVASLLVRNTSDRSQYLDLGRFGLRSVNVNVTGPQGDSHYVSADEARTCFATCLHTSMVKELAAGEEVAAFVLLNRWQPFTAVGRYSVHVEVQRRAFVDQWEVWADRVEMGDGEARGLYTTSEDQAWLEEPVLRSNTVTVDVGPRDETRLRTVVETLWDRADEGDQAAALALAWMVDPVAVPVLARLVGLGDGRIIEVLAAATRAATPEAVDVLSQLGAANLVRQDTVLPELRRIARDETAHPEARRRAEVAIREIQPE